MISYSIKKLPGKSYYYVDYRLEGKRYRKSLKTKVKYEAQHRAKLYIDKLIQDQYGKTTYKLSQLIDRYITHIKLINKEKTFKNKLLQLKRFAKFTGDKNLAEITPSICHDFVHHLLQNQLHTTNVNRHVQTLKHLFNLGIDWDMCYTNPFRKIKLFKEKSRMRYLTESEVSRLLTAARKVSEKPRSKNQRMFYHILLTATYTGMRAGEILNLKWLDIRDNFLILHDTKSQQKRLVPIHPDLLIELKKLNMSKEYIFDLDNRDSSGFFDTWKKVCKIAKVHDVRFHDIRHTWSSNMVKKGASLVTIKEILGHSSLAMTQRYSHSTQDQKLDAIRKLKIDTG